MNYIDTPKGLMFWSRIAKVGQLSYSDRTEEVPEDTLFDAISLDSLVGIPIVDTQHPPKAILSDANLRKQLQKGVVLQNFYRESTEDGEDYLVAPILVWDSQLREQLKQREVNGVSPGYTRKLEGGIQRDRVYDHVLLITNPLEVPRNGKDNKTLLMDSIMPSEAQDTPTPIEAKTKETVVPSAVNADLISRFVAAKPFFDAAKIEINYGWSLTELNEQLVPLLLNQSQTKPVEDTAKTEPQPIEVEVVNTLPKEPVLIGDSTPVGSVQLVSNPKQPGLEILFSQRYDSKPSR